MVLRNPDTHRGSNDGQGRHLLSGSSGDELDLRAVRGHFQVVKMLLRCGNGHDSYLCPVRLDQRADFKSREIPQQDARFPALLVHRYTFLVCDTEGFSPEPQFLSSSTIRNGHRTPLYGKPPGGLGCAGRLFWVAAK